jgi:hypothetical protein
LAADEKAQIDRVRVAIQSGKVKPTIGGVRAFICKRRETAKAVLDVLKADGSLDGNFIRKV